jgi:hypothetical protein
VGNCPRSPGCLLSSRATHAKISHLVGSLPTSCLRTACPKLSTSFDKLLATCNNLVDIIRLVNAKLFQQVCYNLDITILLQPCVVNLAIFLLYHDCIRLVRTTCYKSDNAINLVTYKLLTACSKLVTTTGNKQCEHNLSKACEQICNNLFADL